MTTLAPRWTFRQPPMPPERRSGSLAKRSVLHNKDHRSMRTPIVAGNWKMYKTPAEAVEFAKALVPALSPLNGVERVVCPPFVCIPGVKQALEGSPIKVGAQNAHWEAQGAFTSSIAPGMLPGL